MAERICDVCGAVNPATAEFCRVCDTYFGWDGGQPPTGPTSAPTTTAPVTGPAPATTATAPAPTTSPATTAPSPTTPAPATPAAGTGPVGVAAGATPAAELRPEERAEVPVVSPEQAAVVVTKDAPGTFTLSLKNVSPVVDGMVVHALAPPSWLVVTHDDANLMPGEARTVTVTLAARAGEPVVAQNLDLPMLVRSSLDPTKAAPVAVRVTVPPYGPPPTLTTRPHLLQLDDATDGAFTVTVDNRASNHPRHYALTVQDDEDVVRADVVPPAVDVPALGTADVRVRFSAPAPDPGREATRRLTLSASDDDGPVSTSVTVVQRTAAEEEPEPFTVRLEPSHLHVVGTDTGAFDVIVDNRAEDDGLAVDVTGRDPQRLVAFSFGHDRFVVPGGRATRVHALLRTSAPPPGTSAARPFSVVVSDGRREVEATGVLDVSAPADPITTARLQVSPATLSTEARRGAFAVDVDNRAGTSPLTVRLAARDELGQARFTFSQDQLAVAPGQVARVQLSFDAPLPDGGTQRSRAVTVVASDAAGSVEGAATLTQTARDWRPVAKRWLVWLGALAMIAGALLPWLDGQVVDLELVVTEASTGNEVAISIAAAVAATLLVALLALIMLLGLTGTGKQIRRSAILAALLGVGALVAQLQFPVDDAFVVTNGVPLILVGAVLGFVGGVFARPRARS
ncbi:hypothetical protein GXP71_17810 [Cellulomonas sp. H30R-01]|uniref:hypothetical protein n=1 Tax=Cellulomonas sp. H30R-01 TaxID=2704467 RepID=UPI00138B44EB|nr:hypothetical protein [Cellulomonas sp. H30R-01]QHT57746.1 hypothetical protein GXP71_17810 [Cellulomonas sp. H30R-01]